MPLTPLTPTVRNLGYLRLCRDDLHEIVDHVRSLPGVTIDLEADNNRLDDVDKDLPQLGDRLSYFTLKAYKETAPKGDAGPEGPTAASGPTPTEILTLRLTRDSCTLATTSPDMETRGVISAIRDLARERRRARTWFPHFSQQPMEPVQLWWTVWWVVVAVFSGVTFIVGLSADVEVNSHQYVLPASLKIIISTIAGLVLLFVIVGAMTSRTVLLTSLRVESPRWWKRNRDGFAVGMITGLITGLLTGGLIYLLTRP